MGPGARSAARRCLLVAGSGHPPGSRRHIGLVPARGSCPFELGLPRAPPRDRNGRNRRRRPGARAERSGTRHLARPLGGAGRRRHRRRSALREYSGPWRSGSGPVHSCAWRSGRPRAFRLRRTSAAPWRRSASRSPSSRPRRGSTAVRWSTWGSDAGGDQLKVRCSAATRRTRSDSPAAGARWPTGILRGAWRTDAWSRSSTRRWRRSWPRRPGVRVPEVVTAALGPDGDAFVVTRQPKIEPLESSGPDEVSDETLEAVWEQAAQAARRRHFSRAPQREQRPSARRGPDVGRLVRCNTGRTAIRARHRCRRAPCCVHCPGRARTRTAQGHRCRLGRCHRAACCPYLQRAALTPHLRDLARSHEVDLKELRAAAADATGQEVPELAPLRRVRPKDLLMTAALAFAAYLLISQLADIGFRTIIDQLAEADPAWLIVALLLARPRLSVTAYRCEGPWRSRSRFSPVSCCSPQ